jgi:FkbM family methyltransferase
LTASERFVSYSQNGEDVVLARALRPDKQPGFWIDVGATDPVIDSVTAAFSERGWTGINIEPSEEAFERLCEQRPNEINLRCAIGDRAGFAKLYRGPRESPGLATLVPEMAEAHHAGAHDVPAPVEVEVRTLAEVVDQYAPAVVDFLKVDVEGFERQVLAGADWTRFRPRVVVVEATVPGTTELSHERWEPLLLAEGYEFVLFDGLNRYYVAAGERELARQLAAPANVLDNFVQHHWMVEFSRAEEYALSREQVLSDLRERTDAEIQALARACRLASDRAEFADELSADLRDDLAALQARTARALGEAARLSQHVEEIESTRTFRYTAGIRRVYSVLRRLSGADR